jgi:hypothetical protein
MAWRMTSERVALGTARTRTPSCIRDGAAHAPGCNERFGGPISGEKKLDSPLKPFNINFR